MADKPIDDRQMLQALEKLKAYNSYKSKQSQKPVGPGAPKTGRGVDQDLNTVETWSNDVNNDGAAWGQKKQQESDQKIKDSEKWNDIVRQDEKDAAEEADFRSKLDLEKVKAEMKAKIDEHVKGLQAMGEAGEPGFKGKAAQAKGQAADAKKYIDENLGKSIDESMKRNAEQRKQHKLIAEEMNKQGEEGKAWKKEYGNQPDKFPKGQQADVEAALDRIGNTAGSTASELAAFGTRAAPHIDAMKKVQAWATKLKPQVGSQGPALKTAKASAKTGVAEAKNAFANVENFYATVEGEASDNLDLLRKWTDQNNALAKQWINSNSPKHKAWAQAWMKSQGAA